MSTGPFQLKLTFNFVNNKKLNFLLFNINFYVYTAEDFQIEEFQTQDISRHSILNLEWFHISFFWMSSLLFYDPIKIKFPVCFHFYWLRMISLIAFSFVKKKSFSFSFLCFSHICFCVLGKRFVFEVKMPIKKEKWVSKLWDTSVTKKER